MSDKTINWYGDGIYSKTRNGAETFFVRLWVPSAHKTATWKLKGRTLDAARKSCQRIGDPDKAWAAREVARVTRKQHKEAAYTVGQLFDAFTAGYRSRGRSGFHGTILKAAREFMGDRPASSVTRVVLDAYVKSRESVKRKDGGGRRVSDSSIRKELIGIGTAYKWGIARGLVLENPASGDKMPRPKEHKEEARALTDDEYTNVRDASAPWLRNVITWAAETGMDKGKVRALRLRELDFDRIDGRIVAGRFAMTRDKSGMPVRQVLSTGAIEALNEAGRVKHPSGTVFLDEKGQPIAEKVLDWALACAYKAAKVTARNFRTLRHTFATRALRRGVPVPVLAKMMGHSNGFITATYMHVADDQLEAAAAAMSGPERLVGRGTMGTVPPTGAITGASTQGDSTNVA